MKCLEEQLKQEEASCFWEYSWRRSQLLESPRPMLSFTRFIRPHCLVTLCLLGVGTWGKYYPLLDLGFLVIGMKPVLSASQGKAL